MSSLAEAPIRARLLVCHAVPTPCRLSEEATTWVTVWSIGSAAEATVVGSC